MVPEETLKETFDRIWEEIHGSNLYAGQPRNEASAHSVSRAQHALQLAINSGHDRLMIEAWRMLAYSLTANEQYEEAIPYHKSAVEKLEQLGEHRQAARSRIGYVAALAHVGRLQEALGVASTAEQGTQTGQSVDAGQLQPRLPPVFAGPLQRSASLLQPASPAI